MDEFCDIDKTYRLGNLWIVDNLSNNCRLDASDNIKLERPGLAPVKINYPEAVTQLQRLGIFIQPSRSAYFNVSWRSDTHIHIGHSENYLKVIAPDESAHARASSFLLEASQHADTEIFKGRPAGVLRKETQSEALKKNIFFNEDLISLAFSIRKNDYVHTFSSYKNPVFTTADVESPFFNIKRKIKSSEVDEIVYPILESTLFKIAEDFNRRREIGEKMVDSNLRSDLQYSVGEDQIIQNIFRATVLRRITKYLFEPREEISSEVQKLVIQSLCDSIGIKNDINTILVETAFTDAEYEAMQGKVKETELALSQAQDYSSYDPARGEKIQQSAIDQDLLRRFHQICEKLYYRQPETDKVRRFKYPNDIIELAKQVQDDVDAASQKYPKWQAPIPHNISTLVFSELDKMKLAHNLSALRFAKKVEIEGSTVNDYTFFELGLREFHLQSLQMTEELLNQLGLEGRDHEELQSLRTNIAVEQIKIAQAEIEHLFKQASNFAAIANPSKMLERLAQAEQASHFLLIPFDKARAKEITRSLQSAEQVRLRDASNQRKFEKYLEDPIRKKQERELSEKLF